jgi:hypothetical protein
MAWGDYDNDGHLDFILTGDNSNAITMLYHQNGDGTFSPAPFIFAPYRSSSVEWGDFDNDNYLDLLITGLTDGYSRIYRNWGGTNFVEFMRFPAVYDGKVSWGDFNHDGKLDFAITGAGPYSQIYQNLRGTNFVVLNTGLPQLYYGSVSWADFDRDGNVDLLLTGASNLDGGGAYVYRNSGTGRLGLAWSLRFAYEPGRWIDIDNDGWPDLAIQNWAYQTTYLYHNNRIGGFDSSVSLPFGPMVVADFNSDGWSDLLIRNQVLQNTGSGIWTTVATSLPDLGTSTLVNNAFCGDFDNDGKLDLILSDSSYETSLYRNTTEATNVAPTAPSGLWAEASRTNAVLSWSPSTDDHQTDGLTYNLRVGTRPDGFDVVSPMSAPNGFRRIVRAGNAGTLTSYTLTGLTPGKTYYWSVQAVDNSFAGSPFSSEQSFVAAAPMVNFLVRSVSTNIDLQTGLFYQQVVVTNVGSGLITALRISAMNFPPGVLLVSATGTNASTAMPFVEFTNSLAPGGTITFTLAYYSSNRRPPIGIGVSVEPIVATSLNGGAGETVTLRRTFLRFDNKVAVEFDSLNGRMYAIQYSSDLSLWRQAQSLVSGNGARMIWVDAGPPDTDSLPSSKRFYRVILLTQ